MLAALLFDLDGTLFDTAEDLANALNRLLNRYQRPTLSTAQIRPYAAQGSLALIKLGFAIDTNDPRCCDLRQELFDNYAQALLTHTQFFHNMEALLQAIESKQLKWGIVTNKPKRFTDKLLAHFKLEQRASVVVCPDDLQHNKPSPEGLLLAAKKLLVKPEHCIYIGDQKTDVDAAKAAAMPSIIYLSGYHHPDSNPYDWQADYYAKDSDEILAIIQELCKR